MKYKDKKDILRHIKLGTDEVLYFPYEGKYPLPLRPISSYEFDECFYRALKLAPNKIADLVIKLRLKRVDKDRDINVSSEGFADLQKFYDSMAYWVVYFGMKDFQDEEFRKPNYNKIDAYPNGYYITLRMNYIHEISDFILNSSYQNEEVIKEIFEDEYGREVAYSIHFLKQPLGELSKLTKLQKKYMVYSKQHLREILEGKQKEGGYIISGKKMTLGDFLKSVK